MVGKISGGPLNFPDYFESTWEKIFKILFLLSEKYISEKNAFPKFLSMVDEVPRLRPIRPAMWQAEVDTELTPSASPATAVGQLTLANWRYSSAQ